MPSRLINRTHIRDPSVIILSLVLLALVIGVVVVLASSKARGTKTNQAMKNQPEEVNVRLLKADGTLTDPTSVPRVVKTDEQWRTRLSPERCKSRQGARHRKRLCGIFHDNHKAGVYWCVGCGLPLFRSDAKFDSGTGWPAFSAGRRREHRGRAGLRYGMARSEIHCPSRCDTSRPCLSGWSRSYRTALLHNSASLVFEENDKEAATVTAILAGLLLGVEEAFAKVKGVISTAVGYSGGTTKSPT